jgi:uncharacterized membrane protein YiaA
MLPFLIAGAAIFIVGRANPVIAVHEVGYFRGIALRQELQEIMDTEMADIADQVKFEQQLAKMGKDIERIIDDGRKRQYSSWRTDVLSIGVLIAGALATVIRAWRSAVKDWKRYQPNNKGCCGGEERTSGCAHG